VRWLTATGPIGLGCVVGRSTSFFAVVTVQSGRRSLIN